MEWVEFEEDDYWEYKNSYKSLKATIDAQDLQLTRFVFEIFPEGKDCVYALIQRTDLDTVKAVVEFLAKRLGLDDSEKLQLSLPENLHAHHILKA